MAFQLSEAERITRIEQFGDEKIETIYRKAKTPVTPEELLALPPAEREGLGAAPAINQRTYEAEPGILCDQDVAMHLRDGVKIYCDIYRPDTMEKVPAIIAWSFFGKRPGEGGADYQIIGVPPQTVSTMAKFEGPDPAFWCRHGYAIVNVDPRGVGRSEGDHKFHGKQNGEDGYDFIEWLAVQHWCNGKVGMAGNSGLAMAQWRIASTNPPHLYAIAPWEGTADYYREGMMEGGIPALGFNDDMLTKLTGPGYLDDYAAMLVKYPYINGYWKDKIPKFENIKVPAYITAGWSHHHLRGTMDAFRKIKSAKKWIRTHREFEWPDFYMRENLRDLKDFFDRYLKDVRNGWEMTPKVRLQVMDAFDYDYEEARPEAEFPLKRQKYKKLYLNATANSMEYENPEIESKVSYDAETGETVFNMTFNEETEITGEMNLHMWVEAEGNDDMDLFITVRKLDAEGNFLPISVLGEPHPGIWGKLRVSSRRLDEELSSPHEPVLALVDSQKLSPGEIVPVDIDIVPTSRIWHKGEQIQLHICGRYIRDENWFEYYEWDTNNKGQHVIHTGGQYESYLEVPIIPPRYVSGGFQVR